MLELKRFSQLKEKHMKQFDPWLNGVENLSEFAERKIYEDDGFIKAYNEIYVARKEADEEEQRRRDALASPENNRELYAELIKRNGELIEAIELDPTLKSNVAKELPCEVFQLQYETYRTKVSLWLYSICLLSV